MLTYRLVAVSQVLVHRFVSVQRGYYFAETAAEVYDTIRGLQKMRSGLDAAISGLERALEKFDA